MAFFGQPPLAALLPLSAGQNLADLPDKTAALANLGTLSTSNIMMNSVPLGTIIPFWGTTAPVGYLPCNGQTVNSATYPDLVTFLGGTTSATLPDLRGEFLRGWDNGRGLDVGRGIYTVQTDALQNITANITFQGAGTATSLQSASGALYVSGTRTSYAAPTTTAGSNSYDGVIFDASRVARTSTETRPHNVAVLYCIKAYGALVNTSTANIGNVLTELSNCTKLTQFGNSLGSSGYQNIAGGLILQWGEATTSAVTTLTVTYPITFPTGALSAYVSGINSAGNTQNYATLNSITSANLTVTGFAAGGGSAPAAASGVRIKWIAIGY